MKVSFCVMPDRTVRDVGDSVVRAEAWGADVAWIPDEGHMRDPYVLLGGVASRTTDITLGIGIANPYTRHPMQHARAIATAADLGSGNLIFGIGAGLRHARAAAGAPEGNFLQTTRDCIAVMKRLLMGETVTFENPVFRLVDAAMEFVPARPVPIYVATAHAEAFRMAGALADGVIVGNVAEPDSFAEIVRWIREAAEAAARDPDSIDIVAWNFVLPVDDTDSAYECVRTMIGRSIAIAHREVRALLAIDQAPWRAIHTAVRGGAGAITKDLVPDELVDRLAIVGSMPSCIRRLTALEQAGARMICVRPSLEVVRSFDYEAMVRGLAEGLRGRR